MKSIKNKLFIFGYSLFLISLILPSLVKPGGSIFGYNYSSELYYGYGCFLSTYLATATWGDFFKFGSETYIQLLSIPNTLIVLSPLFVFYQKLRKYRFFPILFIISSPQVLLTPVILKEFEYLIGFYFWAASSLIISIHFSILTILMIKENFNKQ